MAGCGDGTPENPFEAKSDTQIQKLLGDSMDDVKSAHFSAITEDEADRAVINMDLDRDGNCDGSVSIGDSSAEIKGDETWTYMKANEAFWVLSAGGNTADAQALLQLVGDKWIRQPASDFADVCDLDEYVDKFTIGWESAEFTVGNIEEVDGVDAVRLNLIEGGAESSKADLWLEVEKPHRIVKIKATGGDEPGEYAFSEYNEPAKPQLPAKTDWVALSDLSG